MENQPSEMLWILALSVLWKDDVMSSFLKVAIMSASQDRKVKQLNTKQLAEIQFDYAF